MQHIKFILFLIPIAILLNSKNNFQANNFRVYPLKNNSQNKLQNSSNYFLDTIQNGLKGIEDGTVILKSYKKISLPSEEKINNIINHDNYLVPIYDNKDPELSSIKIFKYANVLKKKDLRSREIKCKLPLKPNCLEV